MWSKASHFNNKQILFTLAGWQASDANVNVSFSICVDASIIISRADIYADH